MLHTLLLKYFDFFHRRSSYATSFIIPCALLASREPVVICNLQSLWQVVNLKGNNIILLKYHIVFSSPKKNTIEFCWLAAGAGRGEETPVLKNTETQDGNIFRLWRTTEKPEKFAKRQATFPYETRPNRRRNTPLVQSPFSKPSIFWVEPCNPWTHAARTDEKLQKLLCVPDETGENPLFSILVPHFFGSLPHCPHVGIRKGKSKKKTTHLCYPSMPETFFAKTDGGQCERLEERQKNNKRQGGPNSLILEAMSWSKMRWLMQRYWGFVKKAPGFLKNLTPTNYFLILIFSNFIMENQKAT